MSISSAIIAIKTSYGLAKTIIDVNTDHKVKEVAIELQTSILSLQSLVLDIQSEHSSLLDSERKLKYEISSLNNWKETASKYELKALAPGVFVRSYIVNVSNTEPPHYICTKCYEDGKAYPLNALEKNFHGIHYICPNCGNKITDFSDKVPISMPKRYDPLGRL